MEDLERTQEQYSGRGSVCSAVSDAFYFTKLRGRTGRNGFASGRGGTDRKSDIYI